MKNPFKMQGLLRKLLLNNKLDIFVAICYANAPF